MAVRVRLKKRYNLEGYDIIVTSNGQSRGRTLERIGYYSSEGLESFLRVDISRLSYWLEKGAHCSERVLKIMRVYHGSFKGDQSGVSSG